MGRRLGSYPAFVVTAMTLVALMTPAPAHAQSCQVSSGRYVVRLQPGLLAFPTPTPDDFAAGWIEHGPVVLNIRPRGSRNRSWSVCMRAESPSMGGGKPVSDLEYREEGQSTWTAMTTGDQLLAQGDRGRNVNIRFRIRLDEAIDAAGLYRADYTVTASRQ